jgi:importin-5
MCVPTFVLLFSCAEKVMRDRLILILLACGKTSGTLTNQMLQLINCISTEHDLSFLASLYKSFTDSLRVIGGPGMLTREFHDGVIEATKRQLQSLADRRKGTLRAIWRMRRRIWRF